MKFKLIFGFSDLFEEDFSRETDVVIIVKIAKKALKY